MGLNVWILSINLKWKSLNFHTSFWNTHSRSRRSCSARLRRGESERVWEAERECVCLARSGMKKKERESGLGFVQKEKNGEKRDTEKKEKKKKRRKGRGVGKISCKQFYENAPNNITNSNRVLHVQPVAIPLNFNPTAKTTLINPTVKKIFH